MTWTVDKNVVSIYLKSTPGSGSNPRSQLSDAPINALSLEAGRAVDSRAVDSRTVDSRTVNSRAVDSRAVDSRTVNSRAVDSRAVDSRAVNSRAVNSLAVGRGSLRVISMDGCTHYPIPMC